ncbi:hypothetical protein O3P69_018705 [Scylla paramamosain]|uniref:Uncharacterized protein n=1 Tax=Scylla paramamosain TaxID=85552 RepID=A0AAW0SS81_SCYPA
MPPTIMRCKVLIALIVWACISLVFVVWPAPSAPPFPLPVTSPHPHAAQHKHQLAQGLPLQAPKSPRRWEVRSKGDGEDGNVFYSERRDFNENDKILAYDGEEMGGRMNGDAGFPKCASSTMQTVLRWCARRLGFEHVSSEVYDERQLTGEGRRKLVKILTDFNASSSSSSSTSSDSSSPSSSPSSSSFSYDRHLYYIDFTAEGAKRQPVYINVVREPAERFISSFYYVRSKERLARLSAKGHLRARPSSYWLNRTVEQCVMNRDAECSFLNGTKQETVITYFCGHHEACK